MATSIEETVDLRAADTTAETRPRWPGLGGVVVAVIVATIVGFGLGWMAFADDGTDGSRDDAPADVQAVQEAWITAWNDADGDAVLALMEPGASHYCPMSGPAGMSGTELAQFVEQGWSISDAEILSVTRSPSPEDPTTSTGNSYVVVTEFTLEGNPGWTSVLFVGDEDGELLVWEHRLYG